MECNRFVALWQNKIHWKSHKKNLQNIKAVMNTTSNCLPLKDHINKNINKVYSYRNFEIQLQNKKLLQKIKNKQSPQKYVKTQRKSIGIKKNKKIDYFQNYDKQNQNKDLLEKLKNPKTAYNTTKYIQDYKQKQKYKNILCKFPVQGLKPTKTLIKLQMISQRRHATRPSQCINSSGQRQRTNRTSHTKSRIKSRNYLNYTSKIKQRITRVFKLQKLMINDKYAIIKGTQYETIILLQLSVEAKTKQLIVELECFNNKFNGCYKNLCMEIKYDYQDQEFYID